LGHEAGLFTVTGSLANMLGVRAWVGPCHELLCEAQAHVVRAELGGHGVWHGVTTRTWWHPLGRLDLDAVRRMLSPQAGPYLVSTAAVSVENTHDFAGGTIQPLDDLHRVVRIFHNARDDLAGLGEELAGRFAEHRLTVRGCVGLFEAHVWDCSRPTPPHT
jgi:threonine aldolase